MSEQIIEFGEYCGCETIDAETKGHPVKTADCPIHGPHVDASPECPECRSRGVHVPNCPLAPGAGHIAAGLDGVDEHGDALLLTDFQLTELVKTLRPLPDDAGDVIETVPWHESDAIHPPALRSRTAVEIAMERSEEMAVAVPDLRSTVAVDVGRNPFVQQKEAVLEEITKSDYSMRRRGLTRPERGRVVVARVEFDEQIGSFLIPEATRVLHTQTNMEVVVLACGKNRIDPATGREIHMEYEPEDTLGRHAVIRQHSGVEFIWYDEDGKQKVVYGIGQAEIWFWLDPAPGDEMHHSPELQRALRYVASGLAQKALPARRCCEECFVATDDPYCNNLECPCHPIE